MPFKLDRVSFSAPDNHTSFQMWGAVHKTSPPSPLGPVAHPGLSCRLSPKLACVQSVRHCSIDTGPSPSLTTLYAHFSAHLSLDLTRQVVSGAKLKEHGGRRRIIFQGTQARLALSVPKTALSHGHPSLEGASSCGPRQPWKETSNSSLSTSHANLACYTASSSHWI